MGPVVKYKCLTIARPKDEKLTVFDLQHFQHFCQKFFSLKIYPRFEQWDTKKLNKDLL